MLVALLLLSCAPLSPSQQEQCTRRWSTWLGSLTWGRVVTVGLLVVHHQRRLLRVERAAMVHANARQLLRVVPLAFAAGRRGEVGLRRRGFPGPPSAHVVIRQGLPCAEATRVMRRWQRLRSLGECCVNMHLQNRGWVFEPDTTGTVY
jgi:hypothetical protein